MFVIPYLEIRFLWFVFNGHIQPIVKPVNTGRNRSFVSYAYVLYVE